MLKKEDKYTTDAILLTLLRELSLVFIARPPEMCLFLENYSGNHFKSQTSRSSEKKQKITRGN